MTYFMVKSFYFLKKDYNKDYYVEYINGRNKGF